MNWWVRQIRHACLQMEKGAFALSKVAGKICALTVCIYAFPSSRQHGRPDSENGAVQHGWPQGLQCGCEHQWWPLDQHHHTANQGLCVYVCVKYNTIWFDVIWHSIPCHISYGMVSLSISYLSLYVTIQWNMLGKQVLYLLLSLERNYLV